MKTILFSGCAALCFIAPAQAQSADTEEARQDTISVVGLRPVAAEDVTASVSVLSAADLAVRDSEFIADQLRAVPGLGISRSGTQSGLTQIRIRGAEANHTLVLLNGIEVSDAVNGETDFGLFSGLNLSRIEVARGEQSALYGSDAVGGVINLVTAEATELNAAAEYGTFGTLRGQVSGGLDFGNGNLSAAASAFSTDGVDVSGNDGEKDGSESYSFLITGNQQVASSIDLSGLLTYRATTSQTDPDTDFDGLLDNADRETESDQWLFGARASTTAFGLDHVLTASFNSVVRENFSDDAATDETTGERTKIAYSPATSFEFEGVVLDLAGILDWEQEDYTREGQASVFGDPNQSQTFETLGAAVEARLSVGDLALTASARHDNNDGAFDDADTWRIGAAYNLSPAFRVRASAGEGVKNPTFTELFGFYPGSFVGNPDLQPETSSSWEIGFDHIHGPFDVSLTYFEAELENEIYTSYAPPLFLATPMNRTGESERSGVEGAFGWTISETLRLNASATKIDSTSDSGIQEIRVPEWTGSVSVDWQSSTVEGMRAGFALDYVGTQLDTDFGTFTTVSLGDYLLASGTFEYPVTERFSVTLRGENLFDVRVDDVFGYHAPGATALIGVKLR
ncbi:TonB-dependent receptor [Ponticaulis sp.]|uniref:TonB-dependent receptor plug domain-containing protein n=1 Tax=Ponticaulis sp. TaxID=2020902 RepID=UPI000B71AB60|nr:TonB-dependent receptor [Ponticaulis sp.]MAJ07735.1 TonB-dependent receptor [Ponticaulis sp.]HBH89305.1 TonB-dependent receptor [Hyphomonadaceae bacterium]HBJ94398.1 TonB-dependent receptor [Hyphomonadaceae bacterium]|tara:strand:+ start:17690 stop:19570 length:1881 start_codon:yes stop_codon:yes gene_type:complete